MSVLIWLLSIRLFLEATSTARNERRSCVVRDLSCLSRQDDICTCVAERRFPFKPSSSCTLSALSRPASPAAAPASHYVVYCSCSVVESMHSNNGSCDKAAPYSCTEVAYSVGLFFHIAVISEEIGYVN